MSPSLITLVFPFEVDHLEQVNTALKKLGATALDKSQGALGGRLDDLGIVHYMSIVAVDAFSPPAIRYEEDQKSRDPKESPKAHLTIEITADGSVPEDQKPRDPEASPKAHLAVEITADGSVPEVLQRLAAALSAEFEGLFADAGIERNHMLLAQFLQRHHHPIAAGWGFGRALGQVHNGAPGMTVRRILQERSLAEWLGNEIQKYRRKNTPEWRERSPRRRLDLIREKTWKERTDSKWAFVAEPAPCLAGDPANKWDDKGYNISNPQARKAFFWILNTLLWPLYLPFLLAVAWVAWPAWSPPHPMSPVLTLGAAICLFALLLLALWLAYLRLRMLEREDAIEDSIPRAKQVQDLMDYENRTGTAQNHMATVSPLKAGLLRCLTLRIAFVVVGSGRFVCAPGFLGNNGVIHIARWMRLPGTNQLMFWSNYDGTWESYVADFIADAPSGVTAIWSNCIGFPRSSGLFGGGASNRDRLVQWARRQQQPTKLWYSAYPELSAARIRSNAAIRQGLSSASSDADARDWFSLFGSAPRPPQDLELQEIPTLVLGALSSRQFATCLLVRLGDDVAKAREWLALVDEDTTFGTAEPGKTVVAVAIAATGLSKLGLSDVALGTFPTAFQQGMWPAWRARALGDLDGNPANPNAPENWDWGGTQEKKRPDVIVLVYAYDETACESKVRAFWDAAIQCGHAVVLAPIPLGQKRKGPNDTDLFTEPFGFVDGVSQPVIRGAPRNGVRRLGSDLVEPGEIVLGYPDNVNEIPPSPSLKAQDDPEHLLPDQGPDMFRRRPEFSRYEGTGERDLGRNGTFLVVRQLEQYRKEFHDWCNETYDLLAKSDNLTVSSDGTGSSIRRKAPARDDSKVPPNQKRDIVAHRVAALLVGRWQDGSSLVRNADAPATAGDTNARPDNAFRFGAEDPRGLACPFGAHIRRANPRDTRFHATPNESQTEIEAVNRHRILRIGRRYGDISGDETKEAGLMFMCLNADIERQFEFVQKTWLLNKSIHGLEDEPDPILGSGPRCFTIPLPNGPIKLNIKKDFTKVVGGGYFFMPGRSTLHYLIQEPQRFATSARRPP